MSAPKEVAPRGNVWEFTKLNRDGILQPGRFTKQIPNAQGFLREVINHTQYRMLREDWVFTSAVQVSPRTEGSTIDPLPHLVAVFTDPNREISITGVPQDIDQLVKPEFLDMVVKHHRNQDFFEWGFPADDPLNVLLKGTNMVASSVMAGYNGVMVDGRTRWQTGVGYLDICFQGVDQEIRHVDDRIAKALEEVRPLLARRAVITNFQVPNPRQLFQ